jgi:hypothetical protein
MTLVQEVSSDLGFEIHGRMEVYDTATAGEEPFALLPAVLPYTE